MSKTTKKKPDGRRSNKPPVATQFKPGQSGNPAGKKPGTRNRGTIVKEVLKMASVLPNDRFDELKKLFPAIENNMSIEEVMTIVMVNKAVGGDVRAYEAVMDSAYGRNLDVTISEGAFEDHTPEELENEFYLPDSDEDVEDQ